MIAYIIILCNFTDLMTIYLNSLLGYVQLYCQLFRLMVAPRCMAKLRKCQRWLMTVGVFVEPEWPSLLRGACAARLCLFMELCRLSGLD